MRSFAPLLLILQITSCSQLSSAFVSRQFEHNVRLLPAASTHTVANAPATQQSIPIGRARALSHSHNIKMVNTPSDEKGSPPEPGFLFLLIDPVENKSDAEAIAQYFEERPTINYCCFRKGQEYYLLLWSRNAADIDTKRLFLPPNIKPRALANRRKRVIRSLNGIFKLVIEILGLNDKERFEDVTFIASSYGSSSQGNDLFFWLRAESVLKQNRKEVLYKFLFVSDF